MTASGSPLKNRVALVTGATSGIGQGLAEQLAKAGTDLCLLGRNARSLGVLSQSLEDLGVRAIPLSVDLTNLEEIEKVPQFVQHNFQALDVLVHCAGVFFQGLMTNASLADFRRQLDTNVVAPYALTQILLGMLQASRGQVVFINSSIVANPSPGTIQYAATKHALKGIAEGLRMEVNQDGIRVMAVFPGRTATPMQEKILDPAEVSLRLKHLLQTRDIADVIVSALSLPRTAEVTDIHIRPMLKN